MAGIKWIPVNVIQKVLEMRLTNSFKIYLILNATTNGYTYLNRELISNLIDWTGWTPRTIKKHLKLLVELDWLGEFDGVLYVRSIWWINNSINNPKIVRSVEYTPKWLSCFKGYLAASFIGHLAYAQKVKRTAEAISNSGNEKGFPYQRILVSASFPVSHKSIEKILGVATSTAQEYKKVAMESALLRLEHSFEEVDIKLDDLDSARQISSDWRKLVVRKGKVYRRMPDMVSPLLSYRSGKKSKYIRRDTKGRQSVINR